MPDPTSNQNSNPPTSMPNYSPASNKQAFVVLMRKIIREDTVLPHEIAATISGPLVEVAQTLHHTFQRQGLADFWQVYRSFCNPYPYLNNWRALIDPSLPPVFPPPVPSSPPTTPTSPPTAPIPTQAPAPASILPAPAHTAPSPIPAQKPALSPTRSSMTPQLLGELNELHQSINSLLDLTSRRPVDPPTSKPARADSIRPSTLPPPQARGANKPAIGTRLSDVADDHINWLWKPRIARKKITMLDGAPGLGKSLLLLDLAARVTTGRTMPDGSPGLLGNVLLINAEDGIGDTIKPRLSKAGADLSRIISLSMVTDHFKDGVPYRRPFLLSKDLLKLTEALKTYRPCLLIIDPLTAVAIGHNLYSETSVRAMLDPLQILVEHYNVACIIVRHLTKNEGRENLLYSGTGSIALIGLARSGLLVTRDPFDQSRCLLVHSKNNLSQHADALTYRVLSDSGDERPSIQWGETVNISDYELLHGRGKTPSVIEEILQLLTARSPQPLSIAEIVDELGLNKSTIKVNLRRLFAKGKVKQLAGKGTYYIEQANPQ